MVRKGLLWGRGIRAHSENGCLGFRKLRKQALEEPHFPLSATGKSPRIKGNDYILPLEAGQWDGRPVWQSKGNFWSLITDSKQRHI